MPVNGYSAIAAKAFGGLYTLLQPTDLPVYLSPDVQDCAFLPGSVFTRPGLTSVFPVNPNPAASYNYLKTYITQTIQNTMLALDSFGVLWQEKTPNVLSEIGQIENTGVYGNSVSLFGKEYIAIGDGKFGTSIPRQYNNSALTRVSQVGPGAGPSVMDFLPPPVAVSNSGSPSTATIAAAPGGAVTSDPHTYSYYIPPYPPYFPGGYYSVTIYSTVTITTTAAHGLSVGETVNISGVGSITGGATFNGTGFVISVVPSPTTFKFPLNNYYGGTGGSGTATVPAPSLIRTGNIVTVNTATPHGFKPNLTVIISGIANATLSTIVSILRTTGIVTVVTTTPTNVTPGATVNITNVTGDTTLNGQVTVSGVPNSTSFTFDNPGTDGAGTVSGSSTVEDVFNGTYTIASVPTATTFTYQDIGPDSSQSATGTATIQGNVTAGIHQVAVSFITNTDYITTPSPPVTFIAGGGKLLTVTNIPIGPNATIKGRRLMFTPFIAPGTTLGSFFAIPTQLDIPDNSTTTFVVDFSDSYLINQENQDYLFDLVELGECAGVTEYNERLFWWGERNKVQNFSNLTFDGGFGGGGGGFPGTYPLGWTLDPTYGAGGSDNQVLDIYGSAYEIFGDGTAPIRGMVTQSAFQDVFGVPRLFPTTAYSVRVRLLKGGGLVSGNFVIDVYSPSGGGSIGNATVPQSSLTGAFQEFILPLMSAQMLIPNDAQLRIYGSGTLTNMGYIIVENIEIFPTNQPYINGSVRASLKRTPKATTKEPILPATGLSPWQKEMVRMSVAFSDCGIISTSSRSAAPT